MEISSKYTINHIGDLSVTELLRLKTRGNIFAYHDIGHQISQQSLRISFRHLYLQGSV